MSTQVRLALVAVIVAVALYQQPETPVPVPPSPASGLRLRGLFVGETAATDAVLLAALCDEIADEIEFDGRLEEPTLATGVAFDTLRTRARLARMKGESIGDRQPRVRDEVAAHLDKEVGVDGGPVDSQQRASWVSAYREIAEACRDAVGR